MEAKIDIQMDELGTDRPVPVITIEGMDVIIELDLGKHQGLLEQAKLSLIAFREGRTHAIKKKKHYAKLVGGEKFDDKSLKSAMTMIATDIRHLSDKADTAKRSIEHHTLIVDTLTEQLAAYREQMKVFNGIPNRLVQ